MPASCDRECSRLVGTSDSKALPHNGAIIDHCCLRCLGLYLPHNEKESRDWVPKIKDLASRKQKVHVLFNNCCGNRAAVNARQIKLILD